MANRHTHLFEHLSEPVLPHHLWLKRVYRSILLGLAVVGGALLMGIMGYHIFGHLRWIDALLEASMILGGMGAVAPMTTDAVKIFASFYALFSGFVVLTTSGIILAPWVHRLLHITHCDK